MKFRIGKTHVRIDWLMLLFPCVALLLGNGTRTFLLLLSLTVHEAAHAAAARLLHLPIHIIRLTPFGGMAQTQNPYASSAPRLGMVALAGPAANFLMMLCSAALCQWNILPTVHSAELVRVNAALMFFNLLPALPLDGGRIMYAVLSLFLPRERAASIGILSGRILAALLILFSLWGMWRFGKLNLSPLFAAVFILVSAGDERRAFCDSRMRLLLDNMRPIRMPTPVRLIAVDAATDAHTALQAAVPGKITLYAVYQDGRLAQIIDDRQLIAHIVSKSPDAGFSLYNSK